MFTGLVEGLGRVAWQRRVGEGMDLAVEVAELASGMAVGDSVSLSGCCTTVTRISGRTAEFHLTRESLARTWFSRIRTGDRVNLERALTPTTRMGGHFVQGHVDGVGTVKQMARRPDGTDLTIELGPELMRYCVEKGSISVDGVSLTIARLDATSVTIALIPHTMDVTTLGGMTAGTPVHIEVDVLAKYVERLLAGR